MLKEVRLVDILLKHKQSGVYVSQRKLRLLVFKEKHYNSIAGYRGEKEKFTIEWCQRGTIGHA